MELFNVPDIAPEQKIIDSIQKYVAETGFSNDENKWKKIVFHHLFRFYNEHAKDRDNFSDKSEKEIKEAIYNWLKEDIEFSATLTVNLESKSEGTEQEGYDDIKFENTLWNRGRKYFIFECKRMDETETMTKEYVYRPATKSRNADGGLYRFLINKYAANKDFGGMIGFVVKGAVTNVIKNVKNKISNLTIEENKIKFGQLTDRGLIDETISGNKNTFLSKHVRCDKTSKKIITQVLIYHIFFDFT